MDEAKLKLRQEVLRILMKKYGHENNNRAIYECADEWVEKYVISAGVVSAAVVASGAFVYVNRDSIVDSIKSQAIEAITGSLGGGLGGSLPIGAPDLAPSTQPQASAPAAPSGGLGVPTF